VFDRLGGVATATVPMSRAVPTHVRSRAPRKDRLYALPSSFSLFAHAEREREGEKEGGRCLVD
jgi:hypothetical protein